LSACRVTHGLGGSAKGLTIGISTIGAAMMLALAPELTESSTGEVAVPAAVSSAGDGETGEAPPKPAREAEIVVQGDPSRGEPLEQLNVEGFRATQKVDRAVFGPVARTYGKSVPRPIRKGLRNFLTNLREPVVAANYLLQLKVGKAGETLGRFAINSTIGVAGVFDQAKRKPFNLPRRRNGFANTLGFYGVKPGPFLYLPLIGATTLRDIVGNVVDQMAAPSVTVPPFDQSQYIAPVGVLTALDARNEFDQELERRRAGGDPYGTTRKIYLERRAAEIEALRNPRRSKPALPPE
jgi:phospholipid-binding lipoprotein MlaA